MAKADAKFRKKLALVAVLCTLMTPLFAGDVVGGLLKDSVATFSDSYDLIYYSVRAALANELREQKKSVRTETSVTNERIEAYLESKGILNRRDRQPILRRDFARLIFQRFDLPRGFFTKLLDSPAWYYRDAVRAGLFSDSDAPEGTMSTREMLSVFTRAEQISRAK
ncbi:MAG: hypothetical protein JNJ69_08045 [Leptospiraceae bacterium]|nr:hypothetical protein [Leptospiraceae bacterium]